jgi:hypothetical protein
MRSGIEKEKGIREFDPGMHARVHVRMLLSVGK